MPPRFLCSLLFRSLDRSASRALPFDATVNIFSEHEGSLSEIGKKIGRRIRELRTQRSPSWTQEDLAERAHISVSFLSMIERGERVAHVETLASLAAALEVSLSELFAIPVGNGNDPSDLNNVVQPLADFARSKGLTHQDIERLLGVARAMFSSTRPDTSL